MSIRLTYADTDVPEGVAEKNLVIAVWDNQLEEWCQLDSIADPENNIISAEVTHFTLYPILAYTRPAAINVDNLAIVPTEALAGERIAISVLVSNTGYLTGVYKLELKIDGLVSTIKSSFLNGGDSATVIFSIHRDTLGNHTVSIGGLSGTFNIVAGELPPSTTVAKKTSIVPVTPVEIAGGERILVRVLVTNTSGEQDTCQVSLRQNTTLVESSEMTLAGGASRAVIFTAPYETAASYTVEIKGPSGVFAVEDMPPSLSPESTQQASSSQPTAALNWWLIGGSIAAGIIVGLPVALVVTRRRAQSKSA